MSVIEDVRLSDPELEEGDRDRFAHIVVPASAVTEAYITGEAVTALCGKTWVPNRDPQKFPLCPSCKEILDEIKARRARGEI